jgi:hypothetical protein
VPVGNTLLLAVDRTEVDRTVADRTAGVDRIAVDHIEVDRMAAVVGGIHLLLPYLSVLYCPILLVPGDRSISIRNTGLVGPLVG